MTLPAQLKARSRAPAAAAGRRNVAAHAVATGGKIERKKVPLEMEDLELPINTYSPKKPFKAKIKTVKTLTGPKATGQTCDIVIDHGGEVPFHEGQSYGVIPPGTKVNSRGKEMPHGVRLYSIASSRYGDNKDGKTTTLCVRRATYWDEEMGKEDPAKAGICSNYLCDAKEGDEVTITGPTGKVLLMPEDTNCVLICVATGTGIAPYRSFWHRCFYEEVPNWKFTGLFWLFMGAANSDACLYDYEINDILSTYPDNFRVDYALSREMKNKEGNKMYIQDKIEEYSDEVFDLLDKGAHIYFCGLKGMMPGITGMLQKVASSKGTDYEEWSGKLKEENRFHVEVY